MITTNSSLDAGIIMDRDDEKWLDTSLMKTEILQELLQELFHPYPAEKISAYAVSTKVNHLLNSSLECITPEREKN